MRGKRGRRVLLLAAIVAAGCGGAEPYDDGQGGAGGDSHATVGRGSAGGSGAAGATASDVVGKTAPRISSAGAWYSYGRWGRAGRDSTTVPALVGDLHVQPGPVTELDMRALDGPAAREGIGGE